MTETWDGACTGLKHPDQSPGFCLGEWELVPRQEPTRKGPREGAGAAAAVTQHLPSSKEGLRPAFRKGPEAVGELKPVPAEAGEGW